MARKTKSRKSSDSAYVTACGTPTKAAAMGARRPPKSGRR